MQLKKLSYLFFFIFSLNTVCIATTTPAYLAINPVKVTTGIVASGISLAGLYCIIKGTYLLTEYNKDNDKKNLETIRGQISMSLLLILVGLIESGIGIATLNKTFEK